MTDTYSSADAYDTLPAYGTCIGSGPLKSASVSNRYYQNTNELIYNTYIRKTISSLKKTEYFSLLKLTLNHFRSLSNNIINQMKIAVQLLIG